MLPAFSSYKDADWFCSLAFLHQDQCFDYNCSEIVAILQVHPLPTNDGIIVVCLGVQCSDPPRSLQPLASLPLSCSSFPQSHTTTNSDLISMVRPLMISSSPLFHHSLKLSGRKWKSMSLRLCPAGHWRHQVLSKLSVPPVVVPSRVPGASLAAFGPKTKTWGCKPTSG